MTLVELLRDPDSLLALNPEELAGYALRHLCGTSGFLSRANFASEYLLRAAPPHKQDACAKALMEAWAFLENTGLLAYEPASQYPSVFITRLGRAVAGSNEYSRFLQTHAFPKGSLHPRIADKSYSLFLRGDYETAIFQAMKEVEVCVRNAARLDARSIGVDLMRKAFNPSSGQLRDASEPDAEREALMHLFAGAIGRFKNPSSHRHVEFTDPVEAIEVLHIASHLLRVAEERGAASAA